MNKPDKALTEITRLRFLVGYLGEKRFNKWWDCAFLDTVGVRFLSDVFPRTFLVAGLRSTTEAARLVHDSQIGRVGIFHLFRLPADIEDQLDVRLNLVVNSWENRSTYETVNLLSELCQLSGSRISAPPGPVQIGVPGKILTLTAVSELAAHYESAFSSGTRCFPYFAQPINGKR